MKKRLQHRPALCRKGSMPSEEAKRDSLFLLSCISALHIPGLGKGLNYLVTEYHSPEQSRHITIFSSIGATSGRPDLCHPNSPNAVHLLAPQPLQSPQCKNQVEVLEPAATATQEPKLASAQKHSDVLISIVVVCRLSFAVEPRQLDSVLPSRHGHGLATRVGALKKLA